MTETGAFDLLPSRLAELEPVARMRPAAIEIARAPGRVNLMGEYTDVNDGFVLPAAIDLEIRIAFVASGDRRVGPPARLPVRGMASRADAARRYPARRLRYRLRASAHRVRVQPAAGAVSSGRRLSGGGRSGDSEPARRDARGGGGRCAVRQAGARPGPPGPTHRFREPASAGDGRRARSRRRRCGR